MWFDLYYLEIEYEKIVLCIPDCCFSNHFLQGFEKA